MWWFSDQTCWHLYTQMQGQGQIFYVVSIAVQPILGLTDCIRLGLIQRVHTLQVPDISNDTIKVEFANVFRGLDNLGKYSQRRSTPLQKSFTLTTQQTKGMPRG